MSLDAALAGLVLAISALVSIWGAERAQRASEVAMTLDAVAPREALRSRRRPKRAGLSGAEAGALCTEVAARLRAGDPVERAWDRSLMRLLDTGHSGVIDHPDGQGPGVDLIERSGEAGWMILLGVRFSETTGAPLAEVLERCAGALAESERVREAREVAFAGPRASANVLSVLPAVGVLGAQVLGASPLQWFFSGMPQLLLLAIGVALGLGGRLLSQRMLRSAERAGSREARAPVLCDLAISGLRCGQAIPAVLRALGEAEEGQAGGRHGKCPSYRSFAQVAAELELGATWHEAWTPLPPGGVLLGGALEPAWTDGVSPVPLLRGAAEHARARAVSEAKKAAERLGVKLAFPLGMLLLPSFVILGLMPVFFSLMAGQFEGM